MEQKPSIFEKVKTLIIGSALNPNDRSIFHRLSLIAFFAWVGLGSDGLSSSCYGPEEAFLALHNHTYLAVFVALASVITIFVISASYSHIIELFPTGGGGYLVASKLLSPTFGMISGCALLVDYVLTITISVASGADAFFSFLPAHYLPYKLIFSVFGVSILILLNMRGVKESVIPLVPVFLIFILTHLFAILYAFFTHIPNLPNIVQSTVADVRSATSEIGLFGVLFLIMRSYSLGAGTYTGIEAVSNGLPILREPKVETGKKTMNYMAVSLSFTVFGLIIAYLVYGVMPQHGKTLNAILFEKMTADWPAKSAYFFVLITLLSEATILFVAAQTGFLDGPRVLANMALDRWFPTRFSMLSDRFVTQNGVLIMGGAAIILMALTRGSVHFLVVLYSINVFITFVLSQLGMVRHWWQVRDTDSKWKKNMLINGFGLMLTLFILMTVIFLKFFEGGWLTIIVTGTLVIFAVLVKRHYNQTFHLLGRLETLVQSAAMDHNGSIPNGSGNIVSNPNDKTAVILVNGFNGLGLHTLFSVTRLFGTTFKNFVFVQIGVVDAGNFKGSAEVDRLQSKIKDDVDRYVQYMRHHGYYAEGISLIANDVVDEVTELAPKIVERFPNSVFFGGQLVFPKDTFFTRLLHNYSVFAMQRRFYYLGYPVVILPIRV